MYCTSCREHFPLTAKIYADKQCIYCRREHGVTTNLVVEACDEGSGGKRQFLDTVKLPHYQQQMRAITKIALLEPNMEYKATY